MFKNFFKTIVLVGLFMLPLGVLAEGTPDTLYLKDFNSDITVNSDSSLLITEKITADFSNLSGKHGIFRVLPTVINTDKGKILNPIELISIKDFSGNNWEYRTINSNGTVTWKIGNADKTVTGLQNYQLTYLVRNVIRAQGNFDELYWNLNGNYWDIATEKFSANIHFPRGINKENIKLDYYTGFANDKSKNLATYSWTNEQTLHFQASSNLQAGQGITISASFPPGFIVHYKLSLVDYLPLGWQWLFLPILFFIVLFLVWRRYGHDPHFNKTVIAEYEAPDNLGPLEMGLIESSGQLWNRFSTAAIIKMAATGVITIRETISGILKTKNYTLLKTGNEEAEANLSPAERAVYDAVFGGKTTRELDELKKTFYLDIPNIAKIGRGWLVEKGYLDKAALKIQLIVISVGVVFLVLLAFIMSSVLAVFGYICLGVSLVILLVFSYLMARRTPKGAETFRKIKGFKLFINTAEKYRAQFYEKENMFEKVLPYAIAFGLTSLWIKKMKNIYGEEKFSGMQPRWFVGSSGAGFDADSFTSSLNNMTTAISSSVSATSGAGGAGGAGGGGGGGGGGGW